MTKDERNKIKIEHQWIRDYDVVDHSSSYCKKCGILLCDYLNKNDAIYLSR